MDRGEAIGVPSSSSCPDEMNGVESSGTCQTLCSTNVEPPERLSSTMLIPIIAQCVSFRLELSWNVGSNIAEIVIYEGSHDRTHPNPRTMCSILQS